MDQHIALGDHFAPRDFRMNIPERLGDSPRSLADDLDISLHGVAEQLIPLKIFIALSLDVSRDLGGCLQHI